MGEESAIDDDDGGGAVTGAESWELESSTSILVAGWRASILLGMVAPSLVM